MKKRVYVETTIISYLTARPTRDVLRSAQQLLTRRWWSRRAKDFDLFGSQLLLEEARRGDADAARRRLRKISRLPVLEITPPAVDLSRHHAIPPKAINDALHIALAAVHGINYLLTWNCAHLANAEKTESIGRTVRSSGYVPPVICTPQELMEPSDES